MKFVDKIFNDLSGNHTPQFIRLYGHPIKNYGSVHRCLISYTYYSQSTRSSLKYICFSLQLMFTLSVVARMKYKLYFYFNQVIGMPFPSREVRIQPENKAVRCSASRLHKRRSFRMRNRNFEHK